MGELREDGKGRRNEEVSDGIEIGSSANIKKNLRCVRAGFYRDPRFIMRFKRCRGDERRDGQMRLVRRM
jgi:hypothetical protein